MSSSDKGVWLHKCEMPTKPYTALDNVKTTFNLSPLYCPPPHCFVCRWNLDWVKLFPQCILPLSFLFESTNNNGGRRRSHFHFITTSAASVCKWKFTSIILPTADVLLQSAEDLFWISTHKMQKKNPMPAVASPQYACKMQSTLIIMKWLVQETGFAMRYFVNSGDNMRAMYCNKH